MPGLAGRLPRRPQLAALSRAVLAQGHRRVRGVGVSRRWHRARHGTLDPDRWRRPRPLRSDAARHPHVSPAGVAPGCRGPASPRQPNRREHHWSVQSSRGRRLADDDWVVPRAGRRTMQMRASVAHLRRSATLEGAASVVVGRSTGARVPRAPCPRRGNGEPPPRARRCSPQPRASPRPIESWRLMTTARQHRLDSLFSAIVSKVCARARLVAAGPPRETRRARCRTPLTRVQAAVRRAEIGPRIQPRGPRNARS